MVMVIMLIWVKPVLLRRIGTERSLRCRIGILGSCLLFTGEVGRPWVMIIGFENAVE